MEITQETPQTENNEIIFNKVIEISSDKNNLFKITFLANKSHLNIKAQQKNNLFINSYSNISSMEKIKENKYFSICDNLKEICIEIESRINLKEIFVTEKENNLILLITLPAIKVKEIQFVLKKEEKMEKEKISELTQIIIEMKNEINKLKNENKDLENKYNKKFEEIAKQHKNEIDELKNMILNQTKEINLLKEKIEPIQIKDLKSSKILEGKEEYAFINSLFSKKPFFNLIYSATRDGSYPEDFHRKCDNKGPTITLIKTNDNRKFGGYISKNRQYGNENAVSEKDKNAFIFTIDKRKKYNIKNENTDAFSYSSIRGPNFTVNLGFYCNEDSGNMFLPRNSYESKNNINYDSLNDYEFAGKNNFQAVEIEVFQVIET